MSTSVRIERDEVLELLDQAVARLPDELRAARWLLKERDEFLAKTRRDGEEIIAEAKSRVAQMVQRTEVVKAADHHAREMIDQAEAEARRMKHEAEDYCDQKLASFQVVLERISRTVVEGPALGSRPRSRSRNWAVRRPGSDAHRPRVGLSVAGSPDEPAAGGEPVTDEHPAVLVGVTDLRRHVGESREVARTVHLPELRVSDTVVDEGTDIDVELTLESITGAIAATGTIRTEWTSSCASLPRPVEGDARPVRSTSCSRSDHVEGETYPIGRETIDLEPLIRESVLLSLPSGAALPGGLPWSASRGRSRSRSPPTTRPRTGAARRSALGRPRRAAGRVRGVMPRRSGGGR